MRRFLSYVLPFLLIIIFFRFFNFILFYAIRFWYITLPLGLYIFYEIRKSRKQKKFKDQTGLDPDKEVKLKDKPVIEDDEK
ncbi:MAG: hypothetical protein K9N07_08830 [Candidatus Cloacimonetes bacterium]|nr:hypothetical protein [Candidatus Cloacimonadota bacterium]